MDASPQVTFIVLNWNARPYLEVCLPSILSQQGIPFQVWLVDNHSHDDSVAWVREHWPQVRVISLAPNKGFAGGNNAALHQLDTPYAVLLNPDVVLESNFLSHLLQPLLEDPTVGLVGAKLFYPDGRLQHVGGLIYSPLGLAGHVGHREEDTGQYETITEATYVIAAAAALRREILEHIGYLDEGYFLYYEDADWCERIRRGGWRVVVAPQARLTHHESVLTGKDSFNYYRNFHRGRWRYILKHFAAPTLSRETLPTEAAWLKNRSLKEQHAAAYAYIDTLNTWPAILKARTRDGATPLSETESLTIQQGLQQLYLQAWQSPALPQAQHHLQQMLTLAEVRPRPFHSALPLLGSMIAALRSAWNQIEAAPYLEPIRSQQNEVNQLVVTLSQEYLSVLHTVATTNQLHAEQQLALRQQIISLRQQLQIVQQQLHHLAQKVAQLT